MNPSTTAHNNKESFVNQRLNFLVDTFEKGKKAPFARKIGVSAQAVQEMLTGRKSDPSFKVLARILEEYPSVSSDWLVLGKGQMLRNTAPPATSLIVEAVHLVQEYMRVSKQVDGIKSTVRELNKNRALLKEDVDHARQSLEVTKEHMPNFDGEAQKLMAELVEQYRLTLAKAQERYEAFLPQLDKAVDELTMTLNYQGKLEKKLDEFSDSVKPLTAAQPSPPPMPGATIPLPTPRLTQYE